MFKILDKQGGEVTASQQAVFNKISTNNADGYVDGFLNNLNITQMSSNIISIDSGLLSIQGFRSVNDTLATYTVSVTPAEPIPFQLVATYSHYISDENDTLEITTRPVQELRREPLFSGQNAVYEVELAEFTMTADGITDLKATLEKIVYNEQDLSELLDKVKKAEQDSAEAKEIASGLADSIAQANTTADSAKSTANTAKSTADSAKATADSAKTTADGLAGSIAQANTTADSAKSTAESAKATADGLADSIARANTTASQAKTTAEQANSTANTAKSTADNALAGLAGKQPIGNYIENSDFEQLFSETGYCKLPNGHIKQWGKVGAYSTNGNKVQVFEIIPPIAFPNKCVSIVANLWSWDFTQGSTSTTYQYFLATYYNENKIKISVRWQSQYTGSIIWEAIGY